MTSHSEADHWPRRLYLARRSSFQFEPVRWDALQECERERWRHIARTSPSPTRRPARRSLRRGRSIWPQALASAAAELPALLAAHGGVSETRLAQGCCGGGGVSKPRLLDLPHGKQTLIDESDYAQVKDLTLYVGSNGYVYFSVWKDGRSFPQTLHGLLMKTPTGMHTDHINGDKLDNRRSVNLRVVSPAINQINRRHVNRNNSTGIRGVSYCPRLSPSNPWRAQITVNRKNLHLGLFATREEAVTARKDSEREHYPEMCP
jgi:hypothetical protein